MNYTCEYCNKSFSQKSHYDTHKNKKLSCKKCNKNFITQYAYVSNTAIHINNYNKDLKHKPKCKDGQKL